MGTHSKYGRKVMTAAFGSEFKHWGASVEVDYGCGPPARIDGVVGGDVAVEIESRVGKQVRGALCDLVFHRFPKKLLVIEPVHMTDAEVCAEQCRLVLRRFVCVNDFRVVVLRGSGWADRLDADVAAVREALAGLRTQSAEIATGSTDG